MARRRHINPAVAAEGGLTGAASRIRNLVTHDRERHEQLRDEWPDLSDAIDALLKCIDVLLPPEPDPTPSLFDGSFVRIPKPD